MLSDVVFLLCLRFSRNRGISDKHLARRLYHPKFWKSLKELSLLIKLSWIEIIGVWMNLLPSSCQLNMRWLSSLLLDCTHTIFIERKTRNVAAIWNLYRTWHLWVDFDDEVPSDFRYQSLWVFPLSSQISSTTYQNWLAMSKNQRNVCPQHKTHFHFISYLVCMPKMKIVNVNFTSSLGLKLSRDKIACF